MEISAVYHYKLAFSTTFKFIIHLLAHAPCLLFLLIQAAVGCYCLNFVVTYSFK